MTVTIYVFFEDRLAQGAATQLLDRLVRERVNEPWLRELWADSLAAARTYVPLFPRSQARIPSNLDGRAKDLYRGYRAALAEQQRGLGDAVLLFAFDSDSIEPLLRARAGVERVRALHDDQLPLVIAEPTPEFDAWVLMGHEPAQTHEHEALKEVHDELTFDPRERPHALNSTTGNHRDAKKLCARVLCLQQQAAPDDPRVMDALDAPIALLLRRGAQAGFPEFVSDVDNQLLPLLGDRSRIG